jgi:NAD(P)-dependent dehydrogenase (short-subunit alcohol dehydrogenase family)
MLQGKCIVITGAASGIGRAWAEGFSQEGAVVVAADIDAAGLATLPDNIDKATTDVADAEQVKRLIATAHSTHGRIDVLFNNAGVGYRHRVEDSSDGAFEAHVAIHLFGCVYGMRAVIPIMRQQNYGRIINTISRNAEVDVPGTSAYAAAKAGIWAASRVTAREVSDVDILVNLLIPGPTNTGIWQRDMPQLQAPEATYPTARMLATLPVDGPNGKVFWNEKEYPMFDGTNDIHERSRS